MMASALNGSTPTANINAAGGITPTAKGIAAIHHRPQAATRRPEVHAATRNMSATNAKAHAPALDNHAITSATTAS